MPILDALDGRIDWVDNRAVIPAEAIYSYLNGEKSWEESELSLYCGKTEEQFLRDAVEMYGKDYELYEIPSDHHSVDNKSKFGFTEVKTASLFDSTDTSALTVENMKEQLKAAGVGEKVKEYYGFVNERNDQIEYETYEMNLIAKSIGTYQDELSKTCPTELDRLRASSKEEGKKLAEENGLKFYEISAKTMNGLVEMFEDVAKEYVQIYEQKAIKNFQLKKMKETKAKSRCC